MEKATEAFTYLAADVDKVEFTATTVAPGTDLKTVVEVTDKLGRDVSSEYNVVFESSNENVVKTDGTTDIPGDPQPDSASAIVVAKVQVGDNWVKSAPTTINVTNRVASTFVGFNVYTPTAEDNNPIGTTEAFEKLEADKKADFVYVTDVTGKDGAKNLALYYKDQYGKSMEALDEDLVVTNVTPAIVIVEADGTILPISAGDGYVKVTANDKLEHTIKIVVRAESEIATMELDKTDVSVVAGQEATVKVTFKDQFGTKVDKAPTVKSAASTTATATPGTNLVTINGVKEGTTTVDVSYKVNDALTLKETINVTVVKAGELATYEAVVDATKLDVSGYEESATEENKKDKLPVSTDVVVNEIDANGNKIGAVEDTNITLTEVDKDGKEITDVNNQLLTIAKSKVTAKAPGTAYVQVKVGTLVIDTLEFEVVKTEAYAKSIEFIRNDLVLSANTIGDELSEAISIEGTKATEETKATGLNSIVEVKDQYGKTMDLAENQTLAFTFNVTNKKDLEVNANNEVSELANLSGTADIVITKITLSGEEDSLISAPVVVKLSVKATDQAIVDYEATKYEDGVAIANTVAAGTDITDQVVKLKERKTANADVAVTVAENEDTNELISVADNKVTLDKQVKYTTGSADGTATVTLTFTKGTASKTLNVEITVKEQPNPEA